MNKEIEDKMDKVITDNWNWRLPLTPLFYIMNEGIAQLSKLTEEDIAEVRSDNVLMSDEVAQMLVRTSAIMAREFTTEQLFRYANNILK